MAGVTHIIFRDLVSRETEAYQQLRMEQDKLHARSRHTDDEEAELVRIDAVVKQLEASSGELVDPLFVAVRDLVNDSATLGSQRALLNPDGGVLRVGGGNARSWMPAIPAGASATERRQFERRRKALLETADHSPIAPADVVKISQVLGILRTDAATPPRVTVLGLSKGGDRVNHADVKIVADKSDPVYRTFTSAFYAALGEVSGSFDLAMLVLPLLQQEGDRDGRAGSAGEVDTTEFARVMRTLVAAGVTEREPQLRRRVNESLDKIQAVGTENSIADMSIALPDLNFSTAYQIEANNVEAMGPMICAAMFDELKAFEVVDKLVELSQTGMLPISISAAGAMLYKYWKEAPNRMSDAERRNFYSLTMGIPGGSVNGAANKDFNDLWIRFVSSVSQLVRQSTADSLLRTRIPIGLNQQQVRKAARDLAMNLSAHGYGMVNCAARDLQDQITKMIALLGHADIMSAYGAKDMWQVIDQVATLELGGARNSARYRTLATCGAIITKWLSQNITKFNSATSVEPVIDVFVVLSKMPPSAGPNATRRPTDYDLVNACELWLADTAVSDDRIEQMSQPRESPSMTSKPIQIPAIARELLDQAIPPGLGLGMGVVRH